MCMCLACVPGDIPPLPARASFVWHFMAASPCACMVSDGDSHWDRTLAGMGGVDRTGGGWRAWWR